jgi:hypothetical protein
MCIGTAAFVSKYAAYWIDWNDWNAGTVAVAISVVVIALVAVVAIRVNETTHGHHCIVLPYSHKHRSIAATGHLACRQSAPWNILPSNNERRHFEHFQPFPTTSFLDKLDKLDAIPLAVLLHSSTDACAQGHAPSPMRRRDRTDAARAEGVAS